MTDTSARALAEHCRSLRVVGLDFTRVTVKGLVCLSERCASLQRVTCSMNEASPPSAASLLKGSTKGSPKESSPPAEVSASVGGDGGLSGGGLGALAIFEPRKGPVHDQLVAAMAKAAPPTPRRGYLRMLRG